MDCKCYYTVRNIDVAASGNVVLLQCCLGKCCRCAARTLLLLVFRMPLPCCYCGLQLLLLMLLVIWASQLVGMLSFYSAAGVNAAPFCCPHPVVGVRAALDSVPLAVVLQRLVYVLPQHCGQDRCCPLQCSWCARCLPFFCGLCGR